MTQKNLSEVDIAALVNNDVAFRTWTIVKFQSLDKDIAFIKRVLSPSIWATVLLAAAAIAELLIHSGH